ncbi:MAG: DUF1638 domain-containing protein [Lysobacterales bacterium]|jgi:hypothetical protein
MKNRVLVIACGAIALELLRVTRANGWEHLDFQCLPPDLHNRPERIPEAVRAKIESERAKYRKIFVAYADCGTGGRLDQVLEEYDVERIPGAHCYEFFAGARLFRELANEEPGSFYLTDFLVRSFDRLVVRGLDLERNPQLAADYFGNYKRMVYLAQADSEELQALARQHAAFLGLEYHYRFCGDAQLARTLEGRVT